MARTREKRGEWRRVLGLIKRVGRREMCRREDGAGDRRKDFGNLKYVQIILHLWKRLG